MINIALAVGTLALFGLAFSILMRSFPLGERMTLLKILLLGMLLRLGVVFLFAMFMPDPAALAPDAGTYIAVGKIVAQQWSGTPVYNKGVQKRIGGTHPGYYYLVATLFYTFGEHNYLPAYLNTLLGMIALMLLLKILARWFAWDVVKRFALITTFIPSLILWQSFPLKDTVVYFLVTVTFYSYVRYINKRSLNALVVLVISFIPIYFVRFYITFVILGAIFISTILFAGELSLKRISRALISAFVIFVGLLSFGVGGDMVNRWNKEANVKRLETYRRELSVSRSAVHTDQEYTSSFDIIKYLPIRMTTFLFAPFPWQLVNTRTMVAFVEMPLWWTIFPFVIFGIIFMLQHRNVREFIPLIVYTLLLTTLYSIVEGNMGTAYRMRAQVLPFFFMMASVGISVRKAKKMNVNQRLILRDEYQ